MEGERLERSTLEDIVRRVVEAAEPERIIPNLGNPVSEAEYREAVGIADAVVRWAEKRV